MVDHRIDLVGDSVLSRHYAVATATNAMLVVHNSFIKARSTASRLTRAYHTLSFCQLGYVCDRGYEDSLIEVEWIKTTLSLLQVTDSDVYDMLTEAGEEWLGSVYVEHATFATRAAQVRAFARRYLVPSLTVT